MSSVGRVQATAMSWTEFKTLVRDEYCPRSEIQNMEQEFWNLTMQGSPGVGCMFSASTLVEICVDLCEIVRGYELKFLGRMLVLDLYVLGFQYFSVILVMEWLKEILVKDFPDRF